MDIFLTLIVKLIPLYAVIALGWVAGRYLAVSKESVARLLIYVLSPAVVFHGILTIPFRPALLLLPVIFWIVSVVLCLVFYGIGSFFWKDARRNILAFTSGTGNTGYFGLPVAIILFGQWSVGLIVLAGFGTVLFEVSVGFFMVARGHHSVRESFIRVFRLPALYACVAGIVCNVAGLELPVAANDMFVSTRGAFTVLGLMMIGLGLASAYGKRIRFDAIFTVLAFLAKFAAWPLVIFLLVVLDAQVFHLFDADTHNAIRLLAIVPLAANTVAYATELKTEPEKAATAVFLSTVFALFYIPLMVAVFF